MSAAIIHVEKTQLTIVYISVLKVFEDRLIIRFTHAKVIACLAC